MEDGSLEIRGLISDITDQKKNEEEKNALTSQLQHSRKMEAVGTLAGGIAHNLNNTLFPIMGYTEMALEDAPDDSSLKKSLNEVLEAAIRAKDLIQQIIIFSGQDDEEFETHNLSKIIEKSVNLISATTSGAIRVAKSLPPRPMPVLCDQGQINKMVINVCTNAFQSMERSGGVLNIRLEEAETREYIGAAPPGRYARLTISDTGPGIPEDIIDRIFDPYFTTKPVGMGSGMGLAVVHAILEKHNGAITGKNNPDKGASFEIMLPIVVDPEKQAPPTEAGSPSIGRENILIVDDEAPILNMTKQMLMRLGYRVAAFRDAGSALKEFKRKIWDFDLVITDLSMPEMSGATFSEKIHELRPDIPIIICSGFAEPQVRRKTGAAGISAVLEKPVSKNTIAGAVREALDRRPS